MITKTQNKPTFPACLSPTPSHLPPPPGPQASAMASISLAGRARSRPRPHRCQRLWPGRAKGRNPRTETVNPRLSTHQANVPSIPDRRMSGGAPWTNDAAGDPMVAVPWESMSRESRAAMRMHHRAGGEGGVKETREWSEMWGRPPPGRGDSGRVCRPPPPDIPPASTTAAG